MITKLNINNVATYNQPVEIHPTEVNYFYGSNGSGKTTLSKVISNPNNYSDCTLEWENSTIDTLIYNRDFVKDNFDQSSSIKGIFTLGKDAKDTKEFIAKKREENLNYQKEIDKYNNSIEALNKKEKKLKTYIINRSWEFKVKYESQFKPAFVGHIGSKESFFKKCLNEKDNSAELLNIETITNKCDKVFNDLAKEYQLISEFVFDKLSDLENEQILERKIVGKEDIAIGKLIDRLNNSDWVNEGIKYIERSEGVCPFCQQKIDERIISSIISFFDDTFAKNIEELNKFKQNYYEYINLKITELKSITENDIPIIDFNDLKNTITLIEKTFEKNMNIIEKKIKSPSIEVKIESLESNFKRAQELTLNYRKIIIENNKIVSNIDEERKKLKREIWKFITNELNSLISNYLKEMEGIKKGKSNLLKNIKDRSRKKKFNEIEIEKKESEMTNITHTINEINKILSLFGFNNFKITEATEKGFYKIVRADGSDVNETLSEGEYTFITFLYFYQLLKGSTEVTGITRDKVVVIDDPISSLDSNVLFIVSNLIKEIINDCLEQRNGIKQIFILTHNIYFHKEVTFKGSRENKSNKETYWIVSKVNDISRIKRYDKNPIQTTYELLWRELHNIESINKVTIFNTLRRILEYYFNIIGGLNYEKCINEFEGEEKLICKSLISWINDGSHFINDDLTVYVEEDTIEKYLSVFESIFKKMGHDSHYDMMMRKAT